MQEIMQSSYVQTWLIISEISSQLRAKYGLSFKNSKIKLAEVNWLIGNHFVLGSFSHKTLNQLIISPLQVELKHNFAHNTVLLN